MANELPSKLGKYRVIQELGRGATAVVYLVQDPFSRRKLAIKRAHPEILADEKQGPRLKRLFLNEAELIGKLNHPHIVEVLDAVLEPDEAYLVMEYIEGGTLEQHIRADHLLPMEQVVEIAFKCCEALDFAQRQGVVHRDLKPANLLFTHSGDLKISDFGSAFALNAQHTQVIGLIGSPHYMSPEQIRERPLTAQSDMFSLGVVLYQLLTGALPFEAENDFALMYKINHDDPSPPSQLRPELPEMLEKIIVRALQKERDDRYPNWHGFAKDLALVSQQLPDAQTQVPESERFRLLQKLAFFQDFPEVVLWEVLRLGSWKRFPAHTRLVEQGRSGRSFFVLAEGRAVVQRNEKTLSMLNAGESFGEMAYLKPDNPARSASVHALTEVLVIKFRAESLDAASATLQGCFHKALLRVLVSRLWETDALLTRLL